MSTRPVPVPSSCTASYVVMTPERLEHEDHLPLPHDDLLRHYGTSVAALARLAECPHQVLLQSKVPIEQASAALRDARIQALDLARRHDGVVVELLPPRVIELRPDEVSLAHATQWYVLDYDRLDDGLLVTDGLAQFGLPELLLTGVQRATHVMTDAVVAGIAYRLIAEWPSNDPVGPATITLRDIAFGLGDAQAATTPADRSVDVTLSYDETAHVLRVTLHDDPATLFV